MKVFLLILMISAVGYSESTTGTPNLFRPSGAGINVDLSLDDSYFNEKPRDPNEDAKRSDYKEIRPVPNRPLGPSVMQNENLN